MDEDQFQIIRTSLSNEEMLKEIVDRTSKPAIVKNYFDIVEQIPLPSFENYSAEFIQKFQEASYSPEELKQVIDLVWALDEKHPTLWTCMAKKLIITMMRDRMARG